MYQSTWASVTFYICYITWWATETYSSSITFKSSYICTHYTSPSHTIQTVST